MKFHRQAHLKWTGWREHWDLHCEAFFPDTCHNELHHSVVIGSASGNHFFSFISFYDSYLPYKHQTSLVIILNCQIYLLVERYCGKQMGKNCKMLFTLLLTTISSALLITVKGSHSYNNCITLHIYTMNLTYYDDIYCYIFLIYILMTI